MSVYTRGSGRRLPAMRPPSSSDWSRGDSGYAFRVDHGFSERRACRLIGANRSALRKRGLEAADQAAAAIGF